MANLDADDPVDASDSDSDDDSDDDTAMLMAELNKVSIILSFSLHFTI